MKRFVVMAYDECGDEFRAYEPVIEVPYVPGFELIDYMAMADRLLDKVIDEIKDRYPEAYNIHVEREYSSMSMSEWAEMGYGDSWWL